MQCGDSLRSLMRGSRLDVDGRRSLEQSRPDRVVFPTSSGVSSGPAHHRQSDGGKGTVNRMRLSIRSNGFFRRQTAAARFAMLRSARRLVASRRGDAFALHSASIRVRACQRFVTHQLRESRRASLIASRTSPRETPRWRSTSHPAVRGSRHPGGLSRNKTATPYPQSWFVRRAAGSRRADSSWYACAGSTPDPGVQRGRARRSAALQCGH